jgi:hypothetical protein
VHVQRGDVARGARLWGAASAAEQRLGLPIESSDPDAYQALLRAVETSDSFEAGKAMALEEALADA